MTRDRDAAVVCLRVTGSGDLRASLESVLRHTPAAVSVFITGPEEAAEPVRRCLVELNEVACARDAPVELRIGADAEQALAADCDPADLALVVVPCRVGVGWLDGMSAAAHSEAAVASAVAVSLPGVAPGPVTGRHAGVGPHVLSAGGHAEHSHTDPAGGSCRYIRRSAIELVGLAAGGGPAPFGPQFGPSCVRAGLWEVLADEVIVDPGAPPTGPGLADREDAAVRAVAGARRAREGLSVIVDARNLDGPPDGTRRHVLELVIALARNGRVRVRALLPRRPADDVVAALERVPSLDLVTAGSAGPSAGPRADIVHRPFQIAAYADLAALGRLADRLVVTHQDLISFHSPDHFDTTEDWVGYRAMTRSALRAADGVVFFSAYVRDGALAANLVEAHRADVVPLGVDHVVIGDQPAGPPSPPAGAVGLSPEAEVILCLGADFWHKNRLFALRLVQTLQREHAWSGRLVLAGPSVPRGSSRAAERALLEEDPRLAHAIVELGPVTETDKLWLLRRAGLVLYPTVEEGFGLVPFEAAAHDRPCLWAAGSALAEFLPSGAAGIVAWDVTGAAARALGLLRDHELRAAHITAVNEAGAELRWARTAERMIACYERVCDAPASPAARLEREHGLMQTGLSEDAMRLVGPGGALPPELERPLLALSTHARFGRPVLGVIRAGYEAAHRWSAGRRR